MTATVTRESEDSGTAGALYMAMELSKCEWKLAFTIGAGQAPRLRSIAGGAVVALVREVELAKQRFHLPAGAPVVSCYEAGREGFWVHRALTAQGITNHVVDSASIEVNRRRRRAKTDRLDAQKLVSMLLRYAGGERKVWKVVHVPSVAAEDARHVHRELRTLKEERTRVRNRIHGLLATHGARLPWRRGVHEQLAAVRGWDGAPLPPELQGRLERLAAQEELVTEQIRTLERTRSQRVREQARADEQTGRLIQQLLQVRGIGVATACVLVYEVFGWRDIRNRRQLGALLGMAPTPYNSGASVHEQGISKAGIRAVRQIAVEVAWFWLRHQPHSELTQWYWKRFGDGGRRQRRIGIVALARKLMIALWRYLHTGALPAGAVLKAGAPMAQAA